MHHVVDINSLDGRVLVVHELRIVHFGHQASRRAREHAENPAGDTIETEAEKVMKVQRKRLSLAKKYLHEEHGEMPALKMGMDAGQCGLAAVATVPHTLLGSVERTARVS